MKPIKELLNFSIINIDKPVGPTSFTVSEYVKNQLGLRKTSHFGTLDPKVSGVLPIALGRACRLTRFFIRKDKTYVGIMHTHKEQDIEKLQEIINKNFIGKIKQLPPIKSRVKREVREREVKKFELLEEDENKKDFLFIAEVEGGTYIRKLCHDFGMMIGGAHMVELRRIKAGIFSEEDSINLYDFDKAVEEYKKGNEDVLRKMLMPGEEAVKKIMPIVQIKETAVKNLLTGKLVFKKDVIGEIPEENIFAVFCGDRFIEVAKKTDKKGEEVLARPLFVFN